MFMHIATESVWVCEGSVSKLQQSQLGPGLRPEIQGAGNHEKKTNKQTKQNKTKNEN